MIATRYAWAAAALLLLALVPTVANVYLPHEDPAPALADELPETLPGLPAATPGARDAEWVSFHFHAHDFVSREHGDVTLFAARTTDIKSLFHYPENALTYGRAVTDRHTETFPTPAGPATAQVLEFTTDGSLHVSVYALFYGDEPIDEPYSFMFGELPRRFVGDRAPATLVYLQSGARDDEGLPALRARVLDALASACRELLAR